MNNFYIVTNDLKDRDFEITAQITDYLKRHGKAVTNDPLLIDCVLVLGGDGTLLRASVELAHLGVPFLGINLGNLGFLAEVDKDNIESALTKLIQGEYTTEKRMMLDGISNKAQQNSAQQNSAQQNSAQQNSAQQNSALNDVVIIGNESMQLIYFDLFVNGLKLTNYVADGIVISTPTGSTGYNLSAGGPIVEPRADVILVTPLSAHSMRSRSIILSSDDEIEVLITKGKNGEEQTALAVFDGHNRIVLKTFDRVKITKSAKSTSIIKLSKLNFFEILKQKL
ncbi:MAG: NAD(+)/NADH kinase [Lachnospiraceae bacterium]|nr:NAD(+)/NADH kinase [Lachnospiraceae bacterium]